MVCKLVITITNFLGHPSRTKVWSAGFSEDNFNGKYLTPPYKMGQKPVIQMGWNNSTYFGEITEVKPIYVRPFTTIAGGPPCTPNFTKTVVETLQGSPSKLQPGLYKTHPKLPLVEVESQKGLQTKWSPLLSIGNVSLLEGSRYIYIYLSTTIHTHKCMYT